jgi:UrcA family protein
MKSSIPVISLRRALPVAFGVGALAVLSVGVSARAAAPDQITITAPTNQGGGYASLRGMSPDQVTAEARVAFDPVTLTTNSGVALLNDSVFDAAVKACYSLDPSQPANASCVATAVQSTQPQVQSAIARARNATNG